MKRTTLAVMAALGVLSLLAAACGSDASAPEPAAAEQANQQPYAGWETRPIAALAPDQVDDLLAGRGAGYALAAELNHYPGPTHVLEMADQLGLTADQQASIQEIKRQMQGEVQALGKELVDLETQLDEAFSTGSIAPAQLHELTAAIAGVEGTLRSVHLSAHLDVKALLSEEQISQYDTLRGYTGQETDGQHSGGHQAH